MTNIDTMVKDYKNGVVGLHAVDSRGREISYNADEFFPLASTVKLPINVEAYRQIHRGALNPNTKIRLTERRKSPESGVLDRFQTSYNFSLRDLTYEMMVNSDNTATDMVLEAIGTYNARRRLDRIDRLLTGVDNVRRLTRSYEMDIVMGMVPWCLFVAGYSSEFGGINVAEITTKWKKKTYKEKRASVERVLRENENLDWRKFLISYGDLADERGIGHPLENYTTPRNMTRFTKDVQNDRFGEEVKEDVLDTMKTAEGYIGLYMPEDVVVYSKPGCIDGAVADSGIIMNTMPGWHMAMSIFIKDSEQTNVAGVDMSKMARWCYEEILKSY